VSPLERAKESFLSRAKARSQPRCLPPADPRLNAVGYGSQAGYADGCIVRVCREPAEAGGRQRSVHNRSLMNDIEIIERDLRTRFPDASVRIDAPADPASTWYVDVRGNQQALTIQWRRDRGFGVSTAPGAYGEGAEELYSTIAQVEDRVAELLQPLPAATR
jgi:hypothetical protein